MSLFKQAYDALLCDDVDEKIILTSKLIRYQSLKDMGPRFKIRKIPIPGRPLKPTLVNFSGAPKRDKSELGMIKNIHAICHIEFNAINLALDATPKRVPAVSNKFTKRKEIMTLIIARSKAPKISNLIKIGAILGG